MKRALLLLMGCTNGALESPETDCIIAPPVSGEVRAKQIQCDGEIAEYGEANIGDWLLENNRVKLAIRSTPNRMTQLTGAGGTLIDASVVGEPDAVTEIVPHVDGGWPEILRIRAEDEAIVLSAEDGTNREYRYELKPDSTELTLHGAMGFTVVPQPGTVRRGNWATYNQLNLTSDVDVVDSGGWLTWSDTDTLFIGPQQSVVADRYADIVSVTGSSNGSAIDVSLDGTTQFRLPVFEERFQGDVPVTAQLRARLSGHTSSDWVNPDRDLDLQIGDPGFLSVEVYDDSNQPIPATLVWNDYRFYLPDTLRQVAVGPGVGSGYIDAGPEFSVAPLEAMDIQGDHQISVTLDRIASDAAWVDFTSRAFPDSTERRTVSSLKSKLAAQGIDYAIFNAIDEVAQSRGASSVDHIISASSSSRSGGPYGSLLAWPWSADNDEAAHGAVNWFGVGPVDLLSLMSRSGRRYTAVDKVWIEAAGPISEWDPVPDVIQIDGPEDISILAYIWDRRIASAVVGARTWVHVPGRTKTEILRGIFEGKTVASTGPQLHLLVDQVGPGGSFEIATERQVELNVENPGDLSEVALIGPSGIVIQSWSISELPVLTTVNHTGWVSATSRGVDDWAVTGPVWLDRP